jgi:hypothetical protein
MGSIRSELRRFERRRLRPIFHFFKRPRQAPQPAALIASDAAVSDGPPVNEMEQLLVAMIREKMRHAAAPQAAGGTDDVADRSGSSGLDAFVRSMLAGSAAADARGPACAGPWGG